MSVAASKGGSFPSATDPTGFDISIVRLWREIGAKRINAAEIYRDLLATAQPLQLEVGIGNVCGLGCGHCFLGYEAGPMSEVLVPLEVLFSAVEIFVERLGTRIVAVTDRDALTPNRSIPLFEKLADLRRMHPDLVFGGVTNGLALHRYAEDLRRIRLDYLDISLDGLPSEHDAMRGPGTFHKTLESLRLAISQEIAEKVIVATTLTRFNADSLIELIVELITSESVRWIDVGPLMAVKMQAFQLRELDAVHFIRKLMTRLENIDVPAPVKIFFEICSYCNAFIPGLIEYGYLHPASLRQDRYGHLYQDIPINEKIVITLRPELIPEYWRHTVRVTADGFVAGGCQPLTQPHYADLSVGNIQHEPVEILYRKSLEPGSFFHQMLVAYDRSGCRDKSCFRHCLGGDSFLARSVFGDFERKDPNCVWEEYVYQPTEEVVCPC